MRRGWLLSGAAAVAMAALAQSAMANEEELLVMQENPANWVMPLNNYSSTRYSGSGRSTRTTSVICRSPGPSRPGFFAGTRAVRW